MTTSVRILLPILSSKELDRFLAAPADSLVSPGNLPALAADAKITFCLLAPADVAERFEGSLARNAIGRHSELEWISVDELVLDYAFEVVPSLAYQKGMAGCAERATDTVFVFLQPNLVLADGALRAVARQIRAGKRIICATYLRVDRAGFENLFAGSAVESRFAPRTLVGLAVECLDLRDIGSLIDVDVSLTIPTQRLIWRHDRSTLLVCDFAKALIALCPTRVGTNACGFRDAAFAEAMCPDGASCYLDDSDEFCALELCDPSDSEIAVRFGSPSNIARAHELVAHATEAQRQAAIKFPVVFHARDLPADFVQTRRIAHLRAKRLVDASGPTKGVTAQARWTLAYYLWSVRSFELGRGPLPHGPFAELFAHFRTSHAAGGAVDKRPSVVRSGRKHFSPISLLRWLRQRALGRVPLVSILHPQWPDYRYVAPILRQAVDKPRSRIAYVADGAGIFSRVLGQPDFAVSELVDRAKEDRIWAPATLDLAIIELSTSVSGRCAALTQCALPSLRPGGQVVIYHRNGAGLSYVALNDVLQDILKAFGKPGTRRIARLSMCATPYRRWLNDGFALALQLTRPRRWTDFAHAVTVLVVVGVLTAVSNILTGLRSSHDDASLESCSSATIVVFADDSVSS